MKLAAVVCMGCAISYGALAQQYPVKPVRIVTAEPGGGNDLAARLLAQGLTGIYGTQVIVESRGGASGALAAQAVSKSVADGHTLLLFSSSFWVLPLMKEVPWDVQREFAPVMQVASAPNILVVHPSLPVKSVRELITFARERPGKLDYATGGSGAAAHLAGELFKSMAKVNLTRIPFKGTAPGLTALAGGQVQVMFPAAGAVAAFITSGRVRALAVTSAKPSPVAPNLPPMSASGLAGYEAVSVYGLFAPARTPAAIVQRLNQDSLRVVQQTETRERFFQAGVEANGGSPEELAARIKSDVVRWDKVIKDAGIREE